MWLFTEDGYVSAVQYNAKHDSRKNGLHYKVATENPDIDWLILRARVKGDIVRIAEAIFGTDNDALTKAHFDHNPRADYSYRALVSKDDFALYFMEMIQRIDYDSHFKEVSRDRAPESSGRYGAMMSTWSAMAQLQDTVPYSGSPRTGGKSSGFGSRVHDWYDNDYGDNDIDSGNVKHTPSAGSLAAIGVTSTSSSGGGFPWDRASKNSQADEDEWDHAGFLAGLSGSGEGDDEAPDGVEILDYEYSAHAVAEALVAAGNPSDIDTELISNSDDAGFRLWVAAHVAWSKDNNMKFTEQSVKELATANEVDLSEISEA